MSSVEAAPSRVRLHNALWAPEGLRQSANRRRVLPHDEVKQGWPRRPASSLRTVLGVDVRISESFCFVRVYMLISLRAVPRLKCTIASFRLVSTLHFDRCAHCDRNLGRGRALDCCVAAGSLICTCGVPPSRVAQAASKHCCKYCAQAASKHCCKFQDQAVAVKLLHITSGAAHR